VRDWGRQPRGPKKQKQAPAAPRIPFIAYPSKDGIEIRVGRGSADNDKLSCDPAFRDGPDWWMHVAGHPGSHVVIRSHADDLPSSAPETIKDAAALDAKYSKVASLKRLWTTGTRMYCTRWRDSKYVHEQTCLRSESCPWFALRVPSPLSERLPLRCCTVHTTRLTNAIGTCNAREQGPQRGKVGVSLVRCRQVSKPSGAKAGLVRLNGDVETIKVDVKAEVRHDAAFMYHSRHAARRLSMIKRQSALQQQLHASNLSTAISSCLVLMPPWPYSRR
jgi:hypothetical protein